MERGAFAWNARDAAGLDQITGIQKVQQLRIGTPEDD